MRGLDTARATAIVRREVVLLDDVYVVESVDRAPDAALIQSLRSGHAKVAGAAHDIARVTVTSRSAGKVRLAVTDSLRSYRILDESGKTLGTTAARSTSTHTVDLREVAGAWRIVDIAGPAP